MAEGGSERPSEELLDKYFDTFKHLTTLNIASGVLAVAVLTERYEKLGNTVLLSVLLFAASAVVALGGMEAVLEELRRGPPRPVPHRRALRTWHYASVVFFVLGLTLSLAFALL